MEHMGDISESPDRFPMVFLWFSYRCHMGYTELLVPHVSVFFGDEPRLTSAAVMCRKCIRRIAQSTTQGGCVDLRLGF